ncbi:MAG: hypothetical protein ABSD73_07015 [Candidatus Bathyarchaeia archaeon]|jgi:hypothetical protein
MQSKNEELTAELATRDTWKREPKSFGLYAEYSRRNILETIRTRRADYEMADTETKRKLEAEVSREVADFNVWLEQPKNLESITAHYHAVSLKSLLLGLPIGVKVAQLFSIILDK